MKLFLLSESIKSIYENEVKVGNEIDENNEFGKNLRDSLKDFENFVFICNDPSKPEFDDENAGFILQALRNAKMPFKNVKVLNGKNKSEAKTIIENADLIYLQGGKLPSQLDFLNEIEFKKYLQGCNAVVCGKSAGAMNLGKLIYAYPEDDSELGDTRYLEGQGLHNFILIPHFNLEKGNEFCFGSFDIMRDFYLPDSEGQEFIALPQGSYIFISDDKARVFGEAYVIKNRKIYQVCENEETRELNKYLLKNAKEIKIENPIENDI